MKDKADIAGKNSPTPKGNICNYLTSKDICKQVGVEKLSPSERALLAGHVSPASGKEAADAVSPQDKNKESEKRWFVMRDLKRANAKWPAYKMLGAEHIEVFTPMKWKLTVKRGGRVREEVPFMQDLLFVRSTPQELAPLLTKTPTLQYRYVRGGNYREPMTVNDEAMNRFIGAVQSTDVPCYYTPDEITENMCNRTIRIIGGPLDGYKGRLLTVRGSRVKRLLVELPNFLAVAVEVNPEYIRFCRE